MPSDPRPHDVSREINAVDSPDVGQHLLGPHVVGKRVVVRRVLRGERGPSGGPALTDLLGTCLSWADGRCVVQPEDGPPVDIAVADIVSGKPVPPRPSTRHRVSPREVQDRAHALWPDLETVPVGDWVLRHSPTSTARRANSVLAFGPAGVPEPHLAVAEFYAARGRRPVAAVLPGSAEEESLSGLGWAPASDHPDAVLCLAGVARASRMLRGADVADVELVEESPGLVTARIGTAARGTAAYDADWVGFRGLEVDPAHRRQGLARAVMAALVEWGAEQGATTAYLQVLADNEPAQELYGGLGFTEHHRYRYLAPTPR